jgi:uncharacterized protein DUF1707
MRTVYRSDAMDEVRASDSERDAAVSRLGTAAGEGRLTLEEFGERVERAQTAASRGDLDQLLADLPAPAPPASAATAARTRWQVSPIGGMSWRGGTLDARTVSVSLIGGADLDLRETRLAASEVTLTKVSLIGGVDLKVPRGVRVRVSGFSLLGGRSIQLDDPPGANAPTLHVRAFSLVGGVRVRST